MKTSSLLVIRILIFAPLALLVAAYMMVLPDGDSSFHVGPRSVGRGQERLSVFFHDNESYAGARFGISKQRYYFGGGVSGEGLENAAYHYVGNNVSLISASHTVTGFNLGKPTEQLAMELHSVTVRSSAVVILCTILALVALPKRASVKSLRGVARHFTNSQRRGFHVVTKGSR